LTCRYEPSPRSSRRSPHAAPAPAPASAPAPAPAPAQAIAHLTPGFVGADLEAISKEASTIAVKRIIHRSSLSGSQVSSAAHHATRMQHPLPRIPSHHSYSLSVAGIYSAEPSIQPCCSSSVRRRVNELHRYATTGRRFTRQERLCRRCCCFSWGRWRVSGASVVGAAG
jgi:SpoVK/Ycf46/Vps4 family AAA+-type ATPase